MIGAITNQRVGSRSAQSLVRPRTATVKWSPCGADHSPMGLILSFCQRQLRLAGYILWRISAERGQTMAEYGILIGVIAIVVVAAAVFLGGSITNIFRTTGSHL